MRKAISKPCTHSMIPASFRSGRCAEPNGEWLRLAIALPGFKLWIRAWQVQVGRAKLYLLDTNDPANPPAYRGITTELYGGGPELRLKQELVLGIGGWRLLRASGSQPEVCHLNEGHAAFAVLERARSYMEDNEQAIRCRAQPSPAPATFLRPILPWRRALTALLPSLIERYLRKYAEEKLSISFEELLALGRRDRRDSSEPFNMAYLGDPRQRRCQWRQQTARSSEPTTLSASISQVA